jgi:two-component system chemotaxis response regulator CheB
VAKIRVLVVEDSLTIRKRMLEVLAADPGIDIVGEAADGQLGIDLCQQLRPDVLTLDMMLPVLSGLAATEFIMAYCPTPILIVSASTNRGDLFKTYEALAAGALDALDKPTGKELDDAWDQKLVATVNLISRIKVITHPRARLGRMGQTPAPTQAAQALPPSGRLRAVAIGVSTGGPGALIEILRGLPAGFALPIFLVMHVGKLFTPAFAEWLGAQSSIPVRYAVDGDPLPPHGQGGVLMAPPDSHLVIREGKLRLTQDPERNACRPSIDVLFESFAHVFGAGGAGSLLTGMGKDGAAGLLAIRRAGGRTIAQDEASSWSLACPGRRFCWAQPSRFCPWTRLHPGLACWPKSPPGGR